MPRTCQRAEGSGDGPLGWHVPRKGGPRRVTPGAAAIRRSGASEPEPVTTPAEGQRRPGQDDCGGASTHRYGKPVRLFAPPVGPRYG